MKIEQRFVACDGKEFKTEEECVKYEKTISELSDIIISLIKVKEICREQQLGCQSCTFYNNSSDNCMFREEFPESWNLDIVGDKNEI